MSEPVALKRALPPVYAAAALRLAFPLLVLPLMARRLGADEFGRLGLCLVWAGLLAIVVEGGFLGAATRRAVLAGRGERAALARQVFSARCVLSVPVALAALGVGLWQGGWRSGAGDGLLLAALACAMGWPATWYLQASGQLHRWARVELGVQALLLAATVAFAHSVATYLMLQSAAAITLAALGWRWLRRDLSRQAVSPRDLSANDLSTHGLWSRRQVRAGLRLGATMLPVSLAGAAYSLALPAIASTRMPRSELGLYFLVDRVVRALLFAADPLLQVVYPRIVERFRGGARAALAYAVRWAAAGLLTGAALFAAVLLAWPLAEGWLHGVDPQRLRAVFGVAGWLLPMLMGWKFIGFWMLGSGRYDQAYRACIVAGGIVGAAGAWWAGHDAATLAAVALAAEALVIATAVAGIVLTERQRRRTQPVT